MDLLTTNDDGELLCPSCGDNFTHLDQARVVANTGLGLRLAADGEDGRALVTATPVTEHVGGRRHTLIVAGTCEQGCSFEVVLHQHKGVTESHLRTT